MATPRKTVSTKPAKPAPEVDPDPEIGPPSDEPFVFESSRGQLVVPSLNVGPLPNQFALKRALRAGDQVGVMMMVTEAKASPEVFDLLCELTNDELANFHLQWAQHSGITPGKLPG